MTVGDSPGRDPVWTNLCLYVNVVEWNN